jgi:hypothetical protein
MVKAAFIEKALIIQDYIMLVTFDDGYQVFYNYGKFLGEKWFELCKKDFPNFFIENGDIYWGDYEGISSREVYRDGISAKIVMDYARVS